MAFLYISLCALTALYAAALVYYRPGFMLLAGPGSEEPVFVTVVVSARNEEANLPGLLRCLKGQTYRPDLWEVILVNDRSTDGTARLLDDFTAETVNAKAIHIGQEETSTAPKKQALARAISESNGEVILATDADGRPGPDWILEMARMYSAEVGVVLGPAPYRTDGPYSTFFHKLVALEYLSMAAVAAATVGRGQASTCNGANFSFRKKAFDEVGGYGDGEKVLSGDDDLLLHRFGELTRWKIRYAASPKASVPNAPPPDFRAFVRQRLRFSSKHLAYPGPVVFAMSLIYLFFFLLLAGTVTAFFSAKWTSLAVSVWAVKTVFEHWFLRAAAEKLGGKSLLPYHLPLAPLHVLYVVLVPPLAQILSPRWK